MKSDASDRFHVSIRKMFIDYCKVYTAVYSLQVPFKSLLENAHFVMLLHCAKNDQKGFEHALLNECGKRYLKCQKDWKAFFSSTEGRNYPDKNPANDIIAFNKRIDIVIEELRMYQKAFCGFIYGYGIDKQERITADKDVGANRAFREREWLTHLNLVHAFLKIAQCTYKLELLEEEERKYSANVCLGEVGYIDDVRMYLPK